MTSKKSMVNGKCITFPPSALGAANLVGWLVGSPNRDIPLVFFLVAHILPPALLHSHAWLPKFSDASSLAKCMDDIRLQRIAKCTSCSHFLAPSSFCIHGFDVGCRHQSFFFSDLPGWACASAFRAKQADAQHARNRGDLLKGFILKVEAPEPSNKWSYGAPMNGRK